VIPICFMSSSHCLLYLHTSGLIPPLMSVLDSNHDYLTHSIRVTVRLVDRKQTEFLSIATVKECIPEFVSAPCYKRSESDS
jgi:hypothetical protein